MSQALKLLLHYGIPLAIGVIVAGLLTQFYSFMMAHYCDVAIIGHYKIALNFSALINFFTIPIATVLFPAFSKLDSKNERDTLKSVFSSSVKYSTFFSLPAAVALMVLSTPLISTLYGDKWSYSPFFLSLYLIQYLFVAVGSITIASLLQGLGETKMLLKLNLLMLLVGIPLGFSLIPYFEIVGLIISSLFAGLPGLFYSLYWIWKKYGIRPDFSSSGKIFIAAALAGVVTFLFLNMLSASAWILLATGTLLFLVIYLVFVPLVGGINSLDLGNLRAMLSVLGPISKLLAFLLSLIESLLRIKKKLLKTSEEE